jgi:protein tyrosine phosphatase (PTP) superfamily phosphohydrolase (DUF442 family)
MPSGPALPPPGAVPIPPGGPAPQPLPSGQAQQQIPPPPPIPLPSGQSGSNLVPRNDALWQPGEVTVQLGTPQPIVTEAPTRTAVQDPPTQAQIADVAPKGNTAKPQPAATALPVGIPQFNLARERVGAGLRPLLDDGLDWLKDNGYRTVIYLREPGTADSSDRKQVEKRGMTYVSIELSPQQLTKQTVEDFNKLIADTAAQPVFVYDRDGALAGSLWYLHFRSVDGASADQARLKAAALGLREDRGGLHREMWLRANAVIAE